MQRTDEDRRRLTYDEAREEMVISLPQAARLIGCSVGHGYRLVRDGEFPGAYLFGNTVKVFVPSLMAHIEGESMASLTHAGLEMIAFGAEPSASPGMRLRARQLLESEPAIEAGPIDVEATAAIPA